MNINKDNTPLVIVTWEDSRTPIAQWLHLAEFKPLEVCECISVGFLIYDGEDQKILAPNIADVDDEENIQANGIIHIPTACIQRITLLIRTGLDSVAPKHFVAKD